jgi:hypothetical protein
VGCLSDHGFTGPRDDRMAGYQDGRVSGCQGGRVIGGRLGVSGSNEMGIGIREKWVKRGMGADTRVLARDWRLATGRPSNWAAEQMAGRAEVGGREVSSGVCKQRPASK